jgi:hypothetical protein
VLRILFGQPAGVDTPLSELVGVSALPKLYFVHGTSSFRARSGLALALRFVPQLHRYGSELHRVGRPPARAALDTKWEARAFVFDELARLLAACRTRFEALEHPLLPSGQSIAPDRVALRLLYARRWQPVTICEGLVPRRAARAWPAHIGTARSMLAALLAKGKSLDAD